MGDSEHPASGGGSCQVAASQTGAVFASTAVSNSTVTVNTFVVNNTYIVGSEPGRPTGLQEEGINCVMWCSNRV